MTVYEDIGVYPDICSLIHARMQSGAEKLRAGDLPRIDRLKADIFEQIAVNIILAACAFQLYADLSGTVAVARQIVDIIICYDAFMNPHSVYGGASPVCVII